jgi:hypothetical protein
MGQSKYIELEQNYTQFTDRARRLRRLESDLKLVLDGVRRGVSESTEDKANIWIYGVCASSVPFIVYGIIIAQERLSQIAQMLSK